MGDIDRNAAPAQQLGRHLLVDQIVIGQQHAQPVVLRHPHRR
jgi:hypothetical protein